MEDNNKTNRGCLKAVGIGCGVLMAILALILLLIATNLDSIKQSEWFQSVEETAQYAKQEGQNLLSLRSTLSVSYPAEEIQVNVQFHSGAEDSRRSLEVHFVNPAFEIPEEQAESLAEEIALEVATEFPSIADYDQVVIEFSSQRNLVINFEMSEGYPFQVSDLLDALKGSVKGSEDDVEEAEAIPLEDSR